MELDFTGLMYATGLLVLLGSLGKGIDALLLPAQQKTLRKRLENAWIRVADSKTVDLPVFMAELFIRIQQKLFGKRFFAIRSMLLTLCLSLTWSMVVLIVGECVYIVDLPPESFEDLMWAVENEYDSVLGHNLSLTLPMNFILDTVTFFVTVRLIHRFIISRSSLWRFLLLIADILFALVFAAVCYVISSAIEFGYGVSSISVNVSQYFLGLRSFGELDLASHGNFFLANSTLMPTATYLLLLALLIVARASFHLGKAVLLHLMALGVETQNSIFYYSGVFLGLLVVVIKISVEIAKMVA